MQPLDVIRAKYNIGPAYSPKREDDIHGIEKIRVELIDYPKNPYRAIFEVVTSTWGSRKSWWTRWENTPVEGRIFVVVSALSRNTLPQALESISFTWKIQGLSRSAYDQLARHRHTAIGSVGMRDNNWLDAALVLPRDLLEDKELLEEIKKWWKYTKDLYEKIVKKGQHSWQSARFILPMGTEWRFTWTMNYRAFQELAAARLKFCEQFDTVATVWAMWKTLWDKFPLLAAYVRPGCDWAGFCQYYKMYSLSSLFGSLFKPCGRHPVIEDKKYKNQLKVLFPEVYKKWEEQIESQNIYASWNIAAADPKEIEEKLGIKIPNPNEWDDLVKEAIERDRKFFEE